ncbi:MAG: KEOPS complex subunit Pcc1 [Candidatus Hermodarchaeota archaeon]
MVSKITSTIQINLSVGEAEILQRSIAPDNMGGPSIKMSINERGLRIRIYSVSKMNSFLATINDILEAVAASEKTVDIIQQHT